MASFKQILILFSIGVLALGCGGGSAAQRRGFVPEPGDLLLQDLDCGAMCDAIEKVTTGHKRANFSHVGIAARNDAGEVVVIESVSAGVKITALQDFLARSLDAAGRPKAAVGRLKKRYRDLVAPAIEQALSLKGKPYDKVFAIDNDAYYCSELVYEAFMRANDGKPVFKLKPMTFNDPDTGTTLSAWENYFSELGVPIPEGRLGINPGGISRSPVLTMVHKYVASSRSCLKHN
ncbi:MAG TPA: YiiX/YebB-like N1pC/P60 family cysteine hydrolase [Sedimentisphaerales bacterium]|nr:YiiX/YebB-like N1pC/P60 family cysteine hydrolase [Sedimentisphaerales bacterium]